MVPRPVTVPLIMSLSNIEYHRQLFPPPVILPSKKHHVLLDSLELVADLGDDLISLSLGSAVLIEDSLFSCNGQLII